jgi:hypothetical protein
LFSDICEETAKTASDFSRTSISFNPFLKSVEPLETISQIPSANPIFGAISTEPFIICNSAFIFCSFKNFFTVYGYEVAILFPSKSFKEFASDSFGTAIETLHFEKPKRSIN